MIVHQLVPFYMLLILREISATSVWINLDPQIPKPHNKKPINLGKFFRNIFREHHEWDCIYNIYDKISLTCEQLRAKSQS